MPTLIFIAPDGTRTEVDADGAASVMEAAVSNGIDGIVAECGGSCSCATCHVYVDEAFFGRLPARGEMEDELLDGTACARGPTSRLSCQIAIDDAPDGLVLRLPEAQT
ncbi:MAG: 2Fe-2S iron-sulfur cluster-binding protein [Alphaproteobacteria bacterium]|nr:2Fe-2S iron-sulfur cluster-binding protein [Alphaproteobacteria bacterium]